MTERTRWLIAIVPIVVLSLTFSGVWYFGSYAPHAARVHEANDALDRIELPAGWWQESSVELTGGSESYQRLYDAPSSPPAQALPAFARSLKDAGAREALQVSDCQALAFCIRVFLPPHFMLRVDAQPAVVLGGACMANCTVIRILADRAPDNTVPGGS
jgi:hypothetical protein